MNQQSERIDEAGKTIFHLLLEVAHLFCTLKLSKSDPGGTRGKKMYPLSGRERLGKREKICDVEWQRHRRLRYVKHPNSLLSLKLQVNR